MSFMQATVKQLVTIVLYENCSDAEKEEAGAELLRRRGKR